VRVFRVQSLVPGDCTPYALIHAAGDAYMTNDEGMLAAARRQAGKIGANAVLMTEVRDPALSTRIIAILQRESVDRRGQLLAYRCGEDAAPPATGSGAVSLDELPVFYID
jgi:hypothetical protein